MHLYRYGLGKLPGNARLYLPTFISLFRVSLSLSSLSLTLLPSFSRSHPPPLSLSLSLSRSHSVTVGARVIPPTTSNENHIHLSLKLHKSDSPVRKQTKCCTTAPIQTLSLSLFLLYFFLLSTLFYMRFLFIRKSNPQIHLILYLLGLLLFSTLHSLLSRFAHLLLSQGQGQTYSARTCCVV